MKKLFKHWVSYSIFVNGTEYPKKEPFQAANSTQAEKLCETMLRNFSAPCTSYKIHSIERA